LVEKIDEEKIKKINNILSEAGYKLEVSAPASA
jgi:hypothetical protein